MKVKNLIKKLSKFDQESEIMIMDGFNGGGCPREINLGPTYHKIGQKEEDECSDCEDIVDKVIVVMGYGCY